ncbi:hypothetical protein QZH41_017666, partial [Actinostola sp. cb2023]
DNFVLFQGHNLQEIRVRALKTILFKLEHKLICTVDLVQERELLIRLLEWFNNPQSPMRKEVLGLIESLSKFAMITSLDHHHTLYCLTDSSLSQLGQARVPHSLENQQESFSSSGTLTFFQWLPLSSSDRHIMAVTDSRLHNCSSTLVAKSCEFLSDVLFKDFPAEIFLQRPSVFKSLLELLEFRGDVDGVCVPSCAIHCLKELCRYVHARLMATSDPSLFCLDTECWKSHQNLLLRSGSSEIESTAINQGEEYIQQRGSGDGGLGSDATSSSSSEHAISNVDDEDELVIEALQYSQLAVEEMCVVLLPHALEVLRGQLSSNLQVVTSTTELLFHVGDLIRIVSPDDVWVEGSQHNIVMAPSVIPSLKLLGEVIVHHVQYSGYQGHAARPEPNLSTHRTAVIHLTALLVQLLHSLVPLNQPSSNAVSKLLSLAEDSMVGLAYHKSTSVIKESVKLCSTGCSSDISPTIVQTSHSVILRIIAHYDTTIRHEGYKVCLGVVKESLRISHVTHPLSTVCHGILFLLDTSVMLQICCYGLYDEDQEILTGILIFWNSKQKKQP